MGLSATIIGVTGLSFFASTLSDSRIHKPCRLSIWFCSCVVLSSNK